MSKPSPTARELVDAPLKEARRLVGSLEAHDNIPEQLVTVVEQLASAVEVLADAVDAKAAATYGVCRKCGCTDMRGCKNTKGHHAPTGLSPSTCWWADDTHTLCSECAP